MTNKVDDGGRADANKADAEKTETGEASTATSSDIDKMAQAFEQKAREADEAQNRYLRTYADFENYRKRMQRDVADFKRYANEQMARELLNVADNLSLAIQHAAEDGQSQGLREGVELVYKQLLSVLEKFGITTFSSHGEVFDPVKHDAVMQEITDDTADNTVLKVFQEGYMYHDKVLRHAKVSVSKKPLKTENGEEKGQQSSG